MLRRPVEFAGRKDKQNVSTVLIIIFFVDFFTGHEGSWIEALKAHIAGQHPIPWWSYAMLICGIIAMVVSRRIAD